MLTVEEFKREVEAIAEEIGVHPREVHVREMKRKWGSCSTTGRVTFASDLLEQSASKRRETVVHELLHLRYPNHGRMFRVLLKRHSKPASEIQADQSH